MHSWQKYFLLLLLLQGSLGLFAQDCEWLDLIGEESKSTVFGYGITSYKDEIIAIGKFQDSVEINNTVYKVQGKYSTAGYVIKYKPDSTILWSKYFYSTNNGRSNLEFLDVETDANGNIFISGTVNGTADFGNGVIISTPSVTSHIESFILKLDSNGKAKWATTIRTVTTGSFLNDLSITVDNNGDVIAGIMFTNDITFTASPATILYNLPALYGRPDFCAVKYTSNGGFLWAKKYTDVSSDWLGDIGCDSSNNIYLFGSTTGTGFTFGSQSFTGSCNVVLKVDPSGNPIKGVQIKNSLPNSAFSMVVYPNGRVAITGYAGDSVEFPNAPKIYRTGYGTFNSYLAFFDENLNYKWSIKEEPDSIASIGFVDISLKNEHIYAVGVFRNGVTKFGGFTAKSVVNPSSSPYLYSAVLISKLDTLGNVLWLSSGSDDSSFCAAYGATTDTRGNVYINGSWRDSINIFGVGTSASTGFKYSAFVGKIVDITITRGYVRSGPYCAGDTLKVPYTTTGPFEYGNEFIAELSDENGNFTGGERELGRVTDTAGGIVNGVLPLFNVLSSGNYRIRVRSTLPTVQSFYWRDTLRLLIYSKDTANAGADRSICKGQSIQLSTTGGTSWSWTPAKFFNTIGDTVSRTAFVKPDSTTEYRIIISDSSGCGVVDTDFVKITVRPLLAMSIPDTVYMCKGRPYTISPTITGGDSSKYITTIVARDSALVLKPSTYLTVNPDKPRIYFLYLTDSCSAYNIKDTITVIPQQGVSFTGSYDTLICKGDTVSISLQTQTCDATAIKYYWNNGVGTGQNKKLSPNLTTQYRVIAVDTINLAADTLFFSVNIIPRIKIQATSDSTLCVGNPINLSATTQGGDTATLKQFWTDIAQTFTTYSKTIVQQPIVTTTYMAVATDKCPANADTTYTKITLRDSLKIALPYTDTTLCFGNSIQFAPIATGGLTTNYTYTWLLPDNSTASSKNLIATPTTGTSVYKLSLFDACTNYTDSILITTTVLPQLKAQLPDSVSLCYNNKYTLYAKANGGDAAKYTFSFILPDGSSIQADSLSIIAKTTGLYKLVVSDGCSLPVQDTSTILVKVLPSLQQILTTKDTSLCAASRLMLSTSISGGKAGAYSIRWVDNNGTMLSTQRTLSLLANDSGYIVVTVTDNCSSPIADTVKINVLPTPSAKFSLANTIGCPPLDVQFIDSSTNHNPTKNIWLANNNSIPLTNDIYRLTKAGEYSIGLKVKNDLECADSAYQYYAIRVYPKPIANFTTWPDYIEIGKPVTLNNTSSSAQNFWWIWGDGDSTQKSDRVLFQYNYSDTGDFSIKLIATNSYQCTDTAIVNLIIHPPFTISIPNAFTPNGDGLNDVFAPTVSEFKHYTLKIWNRWGQQLLSCESPNGWDGTYDGVPMETGSYVYIISFLSNGNERRTVSGSVQLIR